MTEPAELPAATRRDKSLLGFYVAMGVVAGLVALGVLLAPLAQLHYHARRYRTAKDVSGESLGWVARYAADRHLDRAAIERLLGKPTLEKPDRLFYLRSCVAYDGPAPGPCMGYSLSIKEGTACQATRLVLTDLIGVKDGTAGDPSLRRAEEPSK